ncbi:MAG: dTDP-glucose 4,6-dehydratase [Planctomycetes bacterium]|nr:dTDP-glucose 4,6-dehydratase [Planctomycetota bacterium]
MTPHHRLRTVLVTGGCGFIGSHLIRHLLGSDPQVVVVNLDALTYAGIQERLAEVASAHASRYRFRHGDVCDDQLVERIFQEHGPDTVIHLAAESHVDRAISGPDRFMRTNVLGTMTLLKAAHSAWQGRTDVRFHQVSTDEVFGSLPSTGLFTESSPYRPSNPYSATKAAADHLVQAWHHTYGLPVTISYGTNTYGPQQCPEKLIPLAITRALAGQPIPLYGDGQHIRDWMYVDDHVRGIEAIVRTAETGGRFLVGSHQELTNRDLLERLCRVLDQQRPRHSGAKYRDLIVSAADRPGHDRRYASDTSHLRATLGWRAEVGIDEGLLRTVRWHVEQTGTEGDAVLK